MQKINKEGTIQQFIIKKRGFHPFLIKGDWQVAQLNYIEDQDIKNIEKIDVHYETDEAFVLLEGEAVLIAGVFENKRLSFTAEYMKPLVTYNIPKGTWHNIAMEKESKVLIVEKANTHLSDFEYYKLDLEQLSAMRVEVNKVLTNNRL